MTVVPGFGQILQRGLSQLGQGLQRFAAQKMAIDAEKRRISIEDKKIKEMEQAFDIAGPLLGKLFFPNDPTGRAPLPTGEAGPLGLQKVGQPVAPEVPTQAEKGRALAVSDIDLNALAKQQALAGLSPDERRESNLVAELRVYIEKCEFFEPI